MGHENGSVIKMRGSQESGNELKSVLKKKSSFIQTKPGVGDLQKKKNRRLSFSDEKGHDLEIFNTPVVKQKSHVCCIS